MHGLDGRRRTIPPLSEWPAFVPFGAAHIGALGCVALVAALLVFLVRARPASAPLVRWAVAAGILGFLAFELQVAAREGWLGWKTVLPLELCDAALVLAVVTLLRPRRAPAEIVLLLGRLRDAPGHADARAALGFPALGVRGVLRSPRARARGRRSCWSSAWACGRAPGLAWRMLAVTAGWAAFVSLVNLLLGTNFMYLRHKPTVATPLDWMGPWPVYIGVCGIVALVLFHVARTSVSPPRPILLSA